MKNSEKNNKKIISEKNNNPAEMAGSLEIKRKRGRPRKNNNDELINLKNKKNNNKKINNAESLENKGMEGNQKINKKSEKNKNNSVNNTDIISGSDNQVKHRGRPKGTVGNIRKDRRVNTDPGDNTKFLSHDLKIFRLPNVDINDSQAVQDRINIYFDICTEDDIKPSIASLALAFNVSRFDLYNWVNGRVEYIKNQESLHILKNAYNLINSYYEHMMNTGKINPVAGIFLMKNNMGYKDTTEHVITPNNDNNVTEEDIANKAGLID